MPELIQQLKQRNRELWKQMEITYEKTRRCPLAICDVNDVEKEKRAEAHDKLAREYDHNLITLYILRRLNGNNNQS